MTTNDNAIANAQCERTLRFGFLNAKGIQREKFEHEGNNHCSEILFSKKKSLIIAGSLESANSSILAARRHFKEVVGKKIRILL